MSNPEHRECNTCLWFEPEHRTNFGTGLCHRFPPRPSGPYVQDDESTTFAPEDMVFPTVREADLCGEWRPNKQDEPFFKWNDAS